MIALGLAMFACNLMSLFRQAVMRSEMHHTLATLKVPKSLMDNLG
ncbi:MAG: hypothetical protein ACI9LD_001831 [Polaromonas sp.]